MDSILGTLKRLVGVEASDTSFDEDIIVAANTAIQTLRQAGIGGDSQFVLSDENQTWDALLGNSVLFGQAKSFIQIKVRLLFDPPGNSFVSDALEKQAEELLYRLRFTAEGAY